MMPSDLDSVLTLCDLEPITRLDRIQPFGFLLAVTKAWTVVCVSENLESHLGIPCRRALGMQLDAFVDRDALHDIRNRMAGLLSTGGTERMYGVALVAGRRPVDVAVHCADHYYIVEGETAGSDDRVDAASLVRSMVAKLHKQLTLEGFHKEAARQIRSMTGFDRVMVYRFAPDGAGEVVAEATPPHADSYLGLAYPSSDIPIQARALYLRNTFRIIADVHSAAVPLISSGDLLGHPLDLSLAVSRAVSPVHIEYLRNMGVAASMSISIILDGTLWGLIACHHGAPCLPSFVTRTAAELFGQMYSMTLETRLRRTDEHADARAGESAMRLVTSVAGNQRLLSQVDWLQDAFRPMIQCDGVAACINGNLSLNGSTPAIAEVEAIAQLMALAPRDRLFVTNHLTGLLGEAASYRHQAAGVLGIPLSVSSDDYILLFRRERIHDVTWAGRPNKPTAGSRDIPRLTPRTSFAAFTESVIGYSRPFSLADRKIGEAVRAGLTQVLVRNAGPVEDDQQRTTDRQELLIAELNHRVRNVLALIRGLISQTTGEGGDAASYVKSLNGRVQALARAHDRVTRQNWGPGPLNAIFEDEIAAYVPTRRDRFMILGAEFLLLPQAFSALALIVHELVTNCAKYGALSDGGRVEVTLLHKQGGGLLMKWVECDGPPVRVPTRRGFGSVIIERVIPYDLQGTAIVQYFPAGLEAEFFIPQRYLASAVAGSTAAFAVSMKKEPTSPPDGSSQPWPLAGLAVLLLEDNFIVALEAEDLLKGLGAAVVYTVSTIAAATAVADEYKIDFAVLDIKLGFETSLMFATRLRDSKTPYMFASGYGEIVSEKDSPRSVITISKPYDRDALNHAIARTLTPV